MEPVSYNEPEKVELEDQFILRLPPEEAQYVRNLLQTKPKKIKKKLKLNLEPERGHAIVTVDGKEIKGALLKLPTITESYKTNDRAFLLKTADICQILDCTNKGALARNSGAPHGLTPPLKNVRKHRFRKGLINKDDAAINLQKELFYLLQADLEAVSTKFEIIYDSSNGGKNIDRNNKESRKTSDGAFERQDRVEIELFGNVLTDSEETDSNVEDVE